MSSLQLTITPHQGWNQKIYLMLLKFFMLTKIEHEQQIERERKHKELVFFILSLK